jgi:hypothetical protein
MLSSRRRKRENEGHTVRIVIRAREQQRGGMEVDLDFSSLANPAACPRLAVRAPRALGSGSRRWSFIHAGRSVMGQPNLGSDTDANVRERAVMKELDGVRGEQAMRTGYRGRRRLRVQL